MSSRPRTGAPRSRKTTAPPPAPAEQREIPSFSTSRETRIAEAAYWRAERRGFAAGHELDDWLEAERQIDEEDARGSTRPAHS